MTLEEALFVIKEKDSQIEMLERHLQEVAEVLDDSNKAIEKYIDAGINVDKLTAALVGVKNASVRHHSVAARRPRTTRRGR